MEWGTPRSAVSKGVSRLINLTTSAFFFPICVVLFGALLTSLNLSGSSVGVYGVTAGQSTSEAGVLYGQVRPIRSDEWLVRTPWLMSQVRNGLPTTTNSGFGPLDVGVVGDLPTRSLDILVRPHHITSWFLPPDRALAAEWWVWQILMVCGVYTFVFAVTRHKAAAAISGLLLALSPSSQWWLAPGSFTTVGYGSLGAGLFVFALHTNSKKMRLALSVLSGWAIACLVASLYVPWIITTLIVLGLAVVGVVIGYLRERATRRQRIKTLGLIAAPFLATFVLFVASYVLRHTEAISDIGSTVYPGQRVGERGGTLSPATLFGGPFDYVAFGPQTVNINGTNQSENSSGVMYAVPIAVMMFGIASSTRRAFRSSGGHALLGLLCGSLALFSWALLPLPSYVGRLLLLDRVPPGRLPPGLALASVLILGVFIGLLRLRQFEISRKVRIVSLLTFGFVQFWAAGLYRVEASEVNPWKPLLISGFLIIAMWLITGRLWKVGGAILIVFASVQAIQVNPIQHGAEALLKNPVSELVEEIEDASPGQEGWVVLGGDVYVRGTIEATGVDFVSGISRYPNSETWKILDPDGRYTDAWNRYAHVVVEAGPALEPPVITSPQADVVKVALDPCDGRLQKMDVTIIVTQDFEFSACGSLIGETVWGTRTVRAYRL